jgi:hypothetical protein
LSHATEANERMGAWPWVAHSLHERARAIESHDSARAARLAARAEQLAIELGMECLRVASGAPSPTDVMR